jgi:plastocyanin
MRTVLRGAVAALIGVALASCSSGSGGGTAPSGGSGGVTITIKDFGYGSPVTVPPGATVTVKQEDPVQHDVFSQAFKTSLLSQGQSATFTAPTAPGSYDFTCTIHPQMHGKLIVQGAATSSSDAYGGGGY